MSSEYISSLVSSTTVNNNKFANKGSSRPEQRCVQAHAEALHFNESVLGSQQENATFTRKRVPLWQLEPPPQPFKKARFGWEIKNYDFTLSLMKSRALLQQEPETDQRELPNSEANSEIEVNESRCPDSEYIQQTYDPRKLLQSVYNNVHGSYHSSYYDAYLKFSRLPRPTVMHNPMNQILHNILVSGKEPPTDIQTLLMFCSQETNDSSVCESDEVQISNIPETFTRLSEPLIPAVAESDVSSPGVLSPNSSEYDSSSDEASIGDDGAVDSAVPGLESQHSALDRKKFYLTESFNKASFESCQATCVDTSCRFVADNELPGDYNYLRSSSKLYTQTQEQYATAVQEKAFFQAMVNRGLLNLHLQNVYAQMHASLYAGSAQTRINNNYSNDFQSLFSKDFKVAVALNEQANNEVAYNFRNAVRAMQAITDDNYNCDMQTVTSLRDSSSTVQLVGEQDSDVHLKERLLDEDKETCPLSMRVPLGKNCIELVSDASNEYETQNNTDKLHCVNTTSATSPISQIPDANLELNGNVDISELYMKLLKEHIELGISKENHSVKPSEEKCSIIDCTGNDAVGCNAYLENTRQPLCSLTNANSQCSRCVEGCDSCSKTTREGRHGRANSLTLVTCNCVIAKNGPSPTINPTSKESPLTYGDSTNTELEDLVDCKRDAIVDEESSKEKLNGEVETSTTEKEMNIDAMHRSPSSADGDDRSTEAASVVRQVCQTKPDKYFFDQLSLSINNDIGYQKA